jgi:hypothetical protein
MYAHVRTVACLSWEAMYVARAEREGNAFPAGLITARVYKLWLLLD